ncbi:hypothetical protein HYH03_017379 [Edaphochlamys debaryana]|uniref:Uncharacterized protein n=1 Tax=Edaphochlamys debaryana TaxID=47281 RepID=A0A835XGR1_9CHLO|nr:hypothetical protein HYH03_017379 [Edaphochlamys debaryana]|eukprot:KAG2483783.1 hypothetical protein HYH03_017379 [Edaphochlamys debaryana]
MNPGSAGASSPPAAAPKAPTPKQQLLALLNERFPALAKIAPDSPPDVVSAAAKRWTAILLAEGPHPHEKDAASLEQSLRQLISAPLPLGLGELVREDEESRATFEVTEQGGGVLVVRLACPQLLALAQAMAAPRPAAASPVTVAASTSAAAAAGTGATTLEEPASAASPELPEGARSEAVSTSAAADRAWGASTTAAAPTPSPRQLLWEPINARFPPVTRVNPDSPPEVVAAAAKRRMVMLLAEVGPPHEVPEVAIVSQLSRRLGGAVLPRSVRALASEAPGTFAVETRADGQLWLRLVDPEFLELASAYAPQGSADASYAPAGSAGVAGRAHGSRGPNAGSGTDFKAQVWTILNRRFLPNMKLLPDATPDAVAAAAKRWMAMLLFESTQAPPYHALPASVLEHRLVNCLHGWALPAPAWVLASSQPETFIVSGMMNGDALITLACPLLLDIARRRANSAAYDPAAVEHWSVGRPAGAHSQAHATSAPAAPPAEVQALRYQPGAAAAKGLRVPEVAKAGATRGPGPARASGAAASGSNGTHSPIETALDELFGPRVKVAADGPHDVVASVAKRWMALVLTEQLPPHELREVALARAVSHRLGTRALPRSVAALAAEDPATFRLALQAKGEWAVRLVCPRLLELAAGAWAEHASLIPAAALAGGPEASATGLAESSGSSSSNGGSGAAGMSPGHKKLMWRELNGRFPPVAELSARSPPEAVAAGAKRRLAALLAEAPAPHELSVAELERALPPLLGGAALTTTVVALVTEGEAARGAFRLAKLPGGDVVRLVCPALLRLAEGLGPEDAAGPAAGGSSSAVAGATLNGGSTAAAGWSIPMPIPVPVPVPVPEPGSRADAWAAALASLALESAPLQAEASSLPYAAVQHVSDPWSAEFAAMLQHCQACAQIGLAVQPPYGRPELVSLYVPPTADGAAAAAVYLLDCASCEQLYGGGEAGLAVRSALAGGIRQVLENEAVAKVVHGARQVAFLEAFCGGGARASPLLDTRVVVAGMGSMLGLRPPPSLAAAPSPAALLTALAAHVGELRAALAATGLWADRPELLAAVAGAHGAALRDEAAAAAGAAAAVPEALQQQEAVAMSRHLPELWAALAEGWWWVAVGAVEGSIGKNRAEAEAAARAWGVGF